MRARTLAALLVASTALGGCGAGSTSGASGTPTASASALPSASGTVDYAQASTWLKLPKSATKPVDVFYLSDTAYQQSSPTDPAVGPIDAPSMISGDTELFTWTGSAFEKAGNVYVPYYRQIAVAAQKSMSDADQMAAVGGTPTSDATAAFEFYLAHYNQGRPFILAGHSQGSSVLSHLLSGYLREHPDVYKRMVAAYVIGYPIGQSYLAANPHLRFAEKATDTGVIVSYNTEAPTIAATNPVMIGVTDAVVINPISWTLSTTTAPASSNLGSYLPDKTTKAMQMVPKYVDATIDTQRGVLVANAPAAVASLNTGMPAGVYHSFDYMFYYADLQANAVARAQQYLRTS